MKFHFLEIFEFRNYTFGFLTARLPGTAGSAFPFPCCRQWRHLHCFFGSARGNSSSCSRVDAMDHSLRPAVLALLGSIRWHGQTIAADIFHMSNRPACFKWFGRSWFHDLPNREIHDVCKSTMFIEDNFMEDLTFRLIGFSLVSIVWFSRPNLF